MQRSDECPFCGFTPVTTQSGRTRGNREITTVDGTMNIPTNSREECFRCNNCQMEYAFESVEIEPFINELKIESYMSWILNSYYPGVSVQDLIRTHRTGIVRKANSSKSFVSEDEAKRQIFICFNYGEVRTFGTFIREKNTKHTYKMTALGSVTL